MKVNTYAVLGAAVIAVTTLASGAVAVTNLASNPDAATAHVSEPAARDEGGKPAGAAELKRYCAGFGGRFEQGWRYDDGGVQWGAYNSCTLPAGRVVCQDGVCRSFRHDLARPEMQAASAEFRAQAAFLAAALSNLVRR